MAESTEISTRRDRRERTEALLAQDDTIANLCADVACGGTLSEWCRQRDISFNVVAAWIEAEEPRRVQYERALLKRDQHNKDLITTALRNFTDFDPLTAYTDDNVLRDLADIPEATRKCIVSIKVSEEYSGKGEERVLVGYVKEVKFADRNRSAETLARALKMLTDKTEHSASPDLATLIAGATK